MSMSGGSHLISGHPSFCFSLIPLNTDPYPGIFYNIVDNFLRLTVQELDIRHRLYSLWYSVSFVSCKNSTYLIQVWGFKSDGILYLVM